MTPVAQLLPALPKSCAGCQARLKSQMAGKPVFKSSFKEGVGIKLCFNTNISL